jgi:hypothetical protein
MKTNTCTSKFITVTIVQCAKLPQLCVGHRLLPNSAILSLPAQMDGIKTLESREAATISKVILMMAAELTAHYQIHVEVSTRLGVQYFGDTTMMAGLSRSRAKHA